MDRSGPPRYFDLQVNGYGGVDFMQENLSDEALNAACERLERDGVLGVLATVITDTIEVMAGRLRNLVRARSRSPLATRIVTGIHIEGPFLSPIDGYRGAHPLDAIRPANWDDMQVLLDACDGLARLVTLAPEHDPGLKVAVAEREIAGYGASGRTTAFIVPSFTARLGPADVVALLGPRQGDAAPMARIEFV